MPITQCRHFNGYKPCGRNEICDSLCPSLSVPSERLLIVHLEALGAVLRSTSLLAGIKRKYPNSHITWVTSKPADQLLKGNPYLDRVLTTERDDLLTLAALKFNAAFCIDKSLKAIGVLSHTQVDKLFGFTADPVSGAILPATDAAKELWELGLNDHKKFFVNKKPETQLSREALELPARANESVAADGVESDDYILQLSAQELADARERRKIWAGPAQWVIGLNTGCANAIPYKKLSIETHRQLIQRLNEVPGVRVVLLGGREDETRNQRIGHGFDVVQTLTHGGLRDGMVSVEACDIVVTGDSLGMHMGIALKKWIVAWFGPTCAQEIELYGRGVKVLTQAGCSPCWKRSCNRDPMCYDLVSIEKLVDGVARGLKFLDATRRFHAQDSDSTNGIRGRSLAQHSSPETSQDT